MDNEMFSVFFRNQSVAAMEFAKKFGKDFTFSVTQVIGLPMEVVEEYGI